MNMQGIHWKEMKETQKIRRRKREKLNYKGKKKEFTLLGSKNLGLNVLEL